MTIEKKIIRNKFNLRNWGNIGFIDESIIKIRFQVIYTWDFRRNFLRIDRWRVNVSQVHPDLTDRALLLVGRRLVPRTGKSHFACISQSDNMMAKSCVTGKGVSSMGKQSDEQRELRECVECEREMVKNRVTRSAKTCLRGNLALASCRRADDSEGEILIRRTNYSAAVRLPGLAGSSGRGKRVSTDRRVFQVGRSIAWTWE